MRVELHPLLARSAVSLAASIRAGAITSEEVVRMHVDRASRTHERIHAVVSDRYELALAEARACDRRLRGGEGGASSLPPLFGVPCSIKECFALQGMPQSSGLVSRRSFRAPADAPAVARLREAGAIPIGVTNTSELCMWMESNNRLYGRTSNPYDPSRIVGGSSGGEGAIVAVGAAPFGLGSDVGGSIRMPAFFCGVFGHKPSPGTVPNYGQFPIMGSGGDRLLATGPIVRRAEDLWPLLQILANPGALAGNPADVSLAGLIVLDVAGNGRLAVSPALRASQEAACRALERRGARVRAFTSPLFRRSLEMWAALMKAAGGATFAEQLGDGAGALSPVLEVVRWAFGRSPHTLPAIGLALLEKLPSLEGDAARELHVLAPRLRAEIVDALGGRGVLLFPPYTRTAPRHNAPILFPIQWMYTAIFNALELPVTQTPLGLDGQGLPLGVQVVGAPGTDAITVAVALALEEDFGGWVPPDVVEGSDVLRPSLRSSRAPHRI
ncbi:MAG TPA: amidase, partial [Polyangiaceae bacterium]|nr:amidase [Polyangiaceae bacterium]